MKLFHLIRILGFRSGWRYWRGTAVFGVDYFAEGVEYE